MAVGQPAYGRP